MEREFKKVSNKVEIDQEQQELSIFPEKFEEWRFNEQYFFTKKVIAQICESILVYFNYDHERISKKVCFIGAPTLCIYMEKTYGISTTLLDIDPRFQFLKQFQFFDITKPKKIEGYEFELIIMDPPFFAITIEQLATAIKVVSGFNFNCAIIVGFRYFDEQEVLFRFRDFKIKRSPFKLEYVTIHPNKWDNYKFYANKSIHLITVPKDLKKKKLQKNNNQKLLNCLK
jgi:hypothetical protein